MINEKKSKSSWLMLLTVLSIMGCDVKSENETLALTNLKKSFGDSVKVQKSPSLVVEYCPDNTCEIFKSTNAQAQGQVSDFAYLYLYFVSKYYYLNDWKKLLETKTVAIDILKRYRQCPETTEPVWASCVLKSLSDKHSIRPAFVRYDEHVRDEEPIDLEAELSQITQSR